MEPSANTSVQDIYTMQAQIRQLQDLVNQLSVEASSRVNHHGSSLANLLSRPPEFDGKDRASASQFLSQVQLYIRANSESFDNDIKKIMFTCSYLRGRAFQWVEPLLKQEPPSPTMTNWPLFLQAFTEALGDPDLHRSYTLKLQILQQTGSAAAYKTTFDQYASFLNWNDDALRDRFYDGLKPEVKDALALRDTDPVNLNDLQTIAIRLDNRIHARHEDKRKSGPVTHARSVTRAVPQVNQPRTPVAPTSTGPAPMDLDATRSTKFQPLTAEERKRRMDHNFCLYCGQGGHKVGQCPARTKWNNRQQLRATVTPYAALTIEEQPKN